MEAVGTAAVEHGGAASARPVGVLSDVTLLAGVTPNASVPPPASTKEPLVLPKPQVSTAVVKTAAQSATPSSGRKRAPKRRRSRPRVKSRCPICFDPWTASGEHRIVSLACGHLFGKSCVLEWIKSKRGNNPSCPQCGMRARRAQIRPIYYPSVSVVDTSRADKLDGELKDARRELVKLRAQLASTKVRLSMIQADYSSTLKELADVKRNAPHNRAGVPIAPANLLTRFAFGTDPLLERKPAVELKHKRESAREREDEREGKRDSAATPSTSTDAGAPLAILPDQTTTTDPHEAAGCDRAGTSCPPIQRTGRIVMALPAHTAPDARRVNDADHAAATDGGMPDCSTADRAAPLPADTVPVREGTVLATALRYGLLLVGCRAQGRPQSKLTHGVTMIGTEQPFMELGQLPAHKGAITGVAVSPSTNMAVVSSVDGSATMCNLETSQVVLRFTPRRPVLSCCWSATSPHVALVGLADGRVCVCDSRVTRGPVATLACSDRPVHSLSVVPDPVTHTPHILAASIHGLHAAPWGSHALPHVWRPQPCITTTRATYCAHVGSLVVCRRHSDDTATANPMVVSGRRLHDLLSLPPLASVPACAHSSTGTASSARSSVAFVHMPGVARARAPMQTSVCTMVDMPTFGGRKAVALAPFGRQALASWVLSSGSPVVDPWVPSDPLVLASKFRHTESVVDIAAFRLSNPDAFTLGTLSPSSLSLSTVHCSSWRSLSTSAAVPAVSVVALTSTTAPPSARGMPPTV